MFDVGFTELVLLFVIGLLILGPERLPRVATQLGRWMGKARRTAHQLRMQLEREMTMNDIMRKKKEREEQGKDAQASGADAAAEPDYPTDEDANDSGHQDAGDDEAVTPIGDAPAPKDTGAANETETKTETETTQQRRA